MDGNMSFISSKRGNLQKGAHESDLNLQKINTLKETYNQMALYQSELAKNGKQGDSQLKGIRKSAAAGHSNPKISVLQNQHNQGQFMSYGTLEQNQDTIFHMEGGN